MFKLLNAKKRHQKWINVTLLVLLMFICLGFCSSPKGLYLNAVTSALHLKRSIFSLATSCRYIVTALINLFFGTLIIRFGAKKLILAGIAALCISMILNSVASSMPLFLLAEAFAGIGFSWSGTTIVGCVVNRWFDTNRGKVSGAVLCANGFGGAAAAQILSPFIFNEQNVFGYRNAYRLVALILACLFVAVLLLFAEKPRSKEEKEEKPKKKRGKGQRWTGISYREALKKPYFYGAALCIFFVGFALQGTGSISAAKMIDAGLSGKFVASIASASSLLLALTKFSTGFIYDRFGLRATLTVSCSSAALQMFLLCAIAPNSLGMTISILYTLFHAIALPLETVMLPIYANDFFGDKDYDRMMSLFVSFNTFGYACGAPLVNLCYDTLGSYTPILIALGFLMIVTLVTLHFIVGAAHKVRCKIEEGEALQ